MTPDTWRCRYRDCRAHASVPTHPFCDEHWSLLSKERQDAIERLQARYREEIRRAQQELQNILRRARNSERDWDIER